MSADARDVFQAFKNHLDSMNFRYDANESELVIRLTVHGDDLPQPTIIRVMGDREVVQILSPIPCKMPEDKRVDGAIAVSVANYGMINGSFDYDMEDGEIRFRVAMSYRGIDLNDDLIKYILGIVFFTTDKYNDRFFMVAKGLMTLEQFIDKEKEN